MKIFFYLLFIFTISVTLISCGGGSSNSDEIELEINSQANTDSSLQNNQLESDKDIEEISTYENTKFDEAIFN
jgi:hypothetical protein